MFTFQRQILFCKFSKCSNDSHNINILILSDGKTHDNNCNLLLKCGLLIAYKFFDPIFDFEQMSKKKHPLYLIYFQNLQVLVLNYKASVGTLFAPLEPAYIIHDYLLTRHYLTAPCLKNWLVILSSTTYLSWFWGRRIIMNIFWACIDKNYACVNRHHCTNCHSKIS